MLPFEVATRTIVSWMTTPTLLLPKTSSMLVGAVVRVRPMWYTIAPGGALV